MRLSLKAMALAGALVWGSAILLVILINHASPGYGSSFLQMMSSVYPGFHALQTVRGSFVGTIEGLADGGVAGLLFAWLYNTFAGLPRHT
jgi:hypothetical protein